MYSHPFDFLENNLINYWTWKTDYFTMERFIYDYFNHLHKYFARYS